jgi:hypothetical protein
MEEGVYCLGIGGLRSDEPSREEYERLDLPPCRLRGLVGIEIWICILFAFENGAMHTFSGAGQTGRMLCSLYRICIVVAPGLYTCFISDEAQCQPMSSIDWFVIMPT